MTRLHLHGGQKKTGTTAVQEFITSHHEILRSRGVRVVLPESGVPGQHALMCEIGGGFRTPIAEHFRNMFAEPLLPRLKRQVAEDSRPLLLSSEVFARRACRGDAEAMFSDLRSAGVSGISVHIFVRPMMAYINSDYSQAIKTFKSRGLTIEEFTEATALDNVNVLESLVELDRLAEVTVRFHPYTQEVVAKGAAVSLLEAIGVDTRGLASEPRLNPPIGPIGLEAMRCIAARLPSDAPFASKLRAVQASLAIVSALQEPDAWLIDDAIASQCASVAKPLDDVMQRIWGGGWRAVLPEVTKQSNRFHPDRASDGDRTVFAAVLGQLESIARAEGLF